MRCFQEELDELWPEFRTRDNKATKSRIGFKFADAWSFETSSCSSFFTVLCDEVDRAEFLQAFSPDACRSRFERSWEDEDPIWAAADTERDARQGSSSATTHMKPSATQPASGHSSSSSGPAHQGSSSSAADTTTSAAADHAAAAAVDTSPALSKKVSWDVPAVDVLMQPQPVQQAGMGPGEEGFRWTHSRATQESQRCTSQIKTMRDVTQRG